MVKKHIVGTIDFKGTVDVTDPCYKKETWCRINDIKIKPGRYTCIYRKQEDHFILYNGNKYPDNRVTRMGVYYEGLPLPTKNSMHCIGTIGVDAGLAGVYENKKDFDDDEWQDFCDDIESQDSLLGYNGFCTSSGYGDGEYPVYTSTDENGEIVAIEIRFIN